MEISINLFKIHEGYLLEQLSLERSTFRPISFVANRPNMTQFYQKNMEWEIKEICFVKSVGLELLKQPIDQTLCERSLS